MSKCVTYFGYGSLVNRQTRNSTERSTRATVHGWERQWAHQAQRPWTRAQASANELQNEGSGVIALTVSPMENQSIDGVLVDIDAAELPALDLRETGYDRLDLPASHFSAECEIKAETICMYVSSADYLGWPNEQYPIIQSYVDCVLAGFRAQFGDEGALRFVQSTRGWAHPVFNDRHDPLYPRAVDLSAEELSWIDSQLIKVKSDS